MKTSHLSARKSMLVCLAFFVPFLFVSASSAAAAAKILRETLSDGVERWYVTPSSDGKSFLEKKIEEIYGILFSPKSRRPFGRSVAFVVGVGKYKYISPQLKSVENDVVAMREFLLERAGFDEVYVAQDNIVNRDLIEKYIKETLVGKMSENDRLLFYYSGHGTDGRGKTGYMQFGNAERGKLHGSNVLAMSTLDDWSREVHIKHFLFILDCCASGVWLTEKSPADSGQLLIQALSGNGSRTVLTAGTADEKAYADEGRENTGNGLFTKAFLTAFESRSVSGKGLGLITVSDIYADLQKTMAAFKGRQGKSTTPRMFTLQENDYRGTFVFLNPASTSARLPKQLLEALGVSEVVKEKDSSGFESRAGIIEVSSRHEGRVYIDGQDKGFLLEEQTRKFQQQPVGTHRVEIKGNRNETKEITVENGKIASVTFGTMSPFDNSGKRPVGVLMIASVSQVGGDIYLNNYKVGVLEKGGRLKISNLVVGVYNYRIDDVSGPVSGTVQISPNETIFIAPRPMSPQNIRIQ